MNSLNPKIRLQAVPPVQKSVLCEENKMQCKKKLDVSWQQGALGVMSIAAGAPWTHAMDFAKKEGLL